jgi:acyl-CoA reductase-like NAD-dependent aldehyde dehydrogenase
MSETTVQRGTIEIPEADHRIDPTAPEALDKAVADLRGLKGAWVAQDVDTRIALLEDLIGSTFEVADEWVRWACDAQRVEPDSPRASELWIGPLLTISNLRSLHTSLLEIREHGRPQPPRPPYQRDDGQVAVPAYPRDPYDRGIFDRMSGEIRLLEDVTLENVDEHQALAYTRPKDGEGAVSLVLGAGNVGAIPATDALYKLFVEDAVVVLKMNPVNEYLGPVFERALEPLVRHGFLRIVYGGAEQGSHLAQHGGVDTIHMTGSDKTHDAIVFGTGEDGRRNKQQRTPRLTKPITSELGSVSPVIVVPGPWTTADLAYHGRNIASMLTNNAGFNCIAVRAIVTHAAWSRRRDLLDAIRDTLARTAPRYAYYPGAEDRWKRFVEEHPEAERYGAPSEGCLPWTLIPDLDPEREEEIAFDTEAFASIAGEVPLDAPRDVARFLDQAVEFCNERLWGTLGASIIVHPRQMDDPEIGAAVERAIKNLRYGAVVLNHWMGLPYALPTLPWGGYPGQDTSDIQSGVGFVHNTLMFERVEKSVLRGPFRTILDPPWFATHPNAHNAFRLSTEFRATQSPASYAKVVAALLIDGQGPRPSALAQYPAYGASLLRRDV